MRVQARRNASSSWAALIFDFSSSGGGSLDPDEPVDPNGWFMFQTPSANAFLTSGLSTAVREGSFLLGDPATRRLFVCLFVCLFV